MMTKKSTSEKPSYEELEKKVNRLEKQVLKERSRYKRLKRKEIITTAVLEKAPLFMMVVNTKGRVEELSCMLMEYSGHDPDASSAMKPGDALRCIHHLDDPEGCGWGPSCKTCRIRQIIQDTLRTGKSHTRVEAEQVPHDDPTDRRTLLLSTTALECVENKTLVFIEDITEQRNFEAALKEQTDFLNALIETISNPIFYKDREGLYTGCNKAFEDFIGIPRSEIIGKTVYDIGPKDLADKYHEKDQLLFLSEGKQRYEWKVKTRNGRVKDVIFDKAVLHDLQGNATGLVGVISDITDRKHSENLIRKLSQMLIQAQERERQMISCELHDTIAQNLSALKLQCSRMAADAVDMDKRTKTYLSDASRLIDQTVKSVRDLAYDLRPASLDLFGLVHAIETFCEEFSEKHDIRVDFQTAGIKGLPVADDMEINLYRLVQEGLNNIQKHADATRAVIRLMGAYPHIILQIEDNGRGFNVKKRERAMIKEKRMGLWSMKERVNLLQGEMTIHSQINEGTKIVIKLALEDRST